MTDFFVGKTIEDFIDDSREQIPASTGDLNSTLAREEETKGTVSTRKYYEIGLLGNLHRLESDQSHSIFIYF